MTYQTRARLGVLSYIVTTNKVFTRIYADSKYFWLPIFSSDTAICFTYGS